MENEESPNSELKAEKRTLGTQLHQGKKTAQQRLCHSAQALFAVIDGR
jgi:hypothetical protein